ncbi:TPA: hypothetical protein ACPJYY_000148 [Haemophilus influenzae]|uniref:hypothetical protein n=1 Tax=Haemophilus influenzae TaxID=727 RepID=UPI000962F913|nr:hypothetical protein [Haemophilus influenzae]MCK8790262.1 hypothetical protein [Haemophilus influenzae]MCK9023827.1 hypothetical protein [Haemophilus influenzae]OLV23604.1 hypothetical protein BOO18_01715 [Haemophilus influenzae]OLV24426.1 hypothetical protein BOO17_02195 [Haemophilus influenzae]
MIIANHLTDKINQKCGQKSKIISYQRRDGSLPDLRDELNASFGLILFILGKDQQLHYKC